MESGIMAFLSAVIQPMFDRVGLGAVISGLAVFIVGWAVFMAVIGKKE